MEFLSPMFCGPTEVLSWTDPTSETGGYGNWKSAWLASARPACASPRTWTSTPCSRGCWTPPGRSPAPATASSPCTTRPEHPGDFLSSGMTGEESERLWQIPGWPQHFQYLSQIPGPLRVPDLLGHIRSLGLPELRPTVEVSPTVSFLAAPVLHLGERVGSVFLAEKEGGQEFTQEDEETLTLFATHAAMAIANARRHREERQAKADLETLLDTSPVGVVVLDVTTGVPKSFNREALSIVDSLRDPDRPPEDLLNLVSFRRADGREFSLREFPMAEVLSVGETVRAEEIVLGVPDGRSVTVLLNATPIIADDGAVESVVVTMQDLAAVEELERLRADFLAMVSHELRAPLTSIKGSAATALGSATDLDPSLLRQFFRIIEDQADHMGELVSDLLDVARIEAGALPVSPEPAETYRLVDRARSAFSSAGNGNHLEIDIQPDLPLVLADRRRIVQVLVNLLSNAARHSPESSVIRVSAAREDVFVAVSVSDEGRGIPAEHLPHLFRKFSGGRSTERSGDRPWERSGDTGLGLAICKGIVEAHGAASGPRATVWAWAPGSLSPCPRWGKSKAARRLRLVPPEVNPGKRRSRRRCWRWTTTPRRCATSGTSWQQRATVRW